MPTSTAFTPNRTETGRTLRARTRPSSNAVFDLTAIAAERMAFLVKGKVVTLDARRLEANGAFGA